MNAIPSGQRPVWLLLDSKNTGGIETHVLLLARELRERGIWAEIVLLADYGPHPLFSAQTVIPVRKLSGPASLGAALRLYRPGVVHTHGYKAGISGRLSCRTNSVPVVSTYHSGDRGRGRMKLYSMIDEQTSIMAPAISVSNEIAHRIARESVVIPNFVRMPRATRRAERSKRAVGFVGRLSYEKGPDVFCRLASQIPSLDFRLFGDGPMRPDLERANPPVSFAGFVKEMPTVWPSIDVLCISSRSEGLPLAALEAMSHGVPVIAFGVGDLPELVASDCGWIVPPGDEDGMCVALQAFAKTPDDRLEELRDAARATVRKRYSPDIQLPRILDAYERAGWNNPTGLRDVA